MKTFPTAVGLAFLIVLIVQDSAATPIMIQKVEHFEQLHTIVKENIMSSDVSNNDNIRASEQENGIRRTRTPSSFSEITFKLFSVYDRRGPWQPKFLPQPPPESSGSR
jgi:hypothetical protein